MLTATELQQVRDDLKERLDSLTHDLLQLKDKCAVPQTFDDEMRQFARSVARLEVELYDLAPISD